MQATALALDHFLCAVGDPIADVKDIGPDHPEFDRAQTIRAAAGVLAKSPGALPALAGVLKAGVRPSASPRVRAHLAAAQAWLDGDPVLAAERYAAVLARWPHDLLALRLMQSCNFFIGRHDRTCAILRSVMPAWSGDRPGFNALLAMAAFAHAESGDAAEAEALGRRALADDPSCPMGVHSVAHALAESGRPGSGARWMREQREQWYTDSRMCTHNAWHLAMFDAEEGRRESALRVLDRWLLPAVDESPIDACDATGLAWKLEDGGASVGRRWKRISDAFERALTPGFWPFVDLHAGLAHLAAGEGARAQRLVEAIERRASGADFASLRARALTLPGLRAVLAWFEGRRSDAAKGFADLRPLLGAAGGSRVQLALFERLGREKRPAPALQTVSAQ